MRKRAVMWSPYLFVLTYLFVGILKHLNGGSLLFFVGLGATVVLGFQISRRILFSIKEKEDLSVGKVTLMNGPTLYFIVTIVSFPICVGLIFIYSYAYVFLI